MNDTKNPVNGRIERYELLGGYVLLPDMDNNGGGTIGLPGKWSSTCWISPDEAQEFAAAMNAQPAAQPQGAVDKDGKPLTKTFRETVVARMMRDEAFCHAILDEQAEQIAAADIAASKTAEANAVIAELVGVLERSNYTYLGGEYVGCLKPEIVEKALTRARAYQNGKPAAVSDAVNEALKNPGVAVGQAVYEASLKGAK